VSFSASEFNWHLILIIVSISAVVSYVGDVLGMKIGKKRISLLGLRPRYTSTVITLCTGVGVALLTLVVAAYTSESIRGAMFGQNYLQRQITSLNKDLSERQSQLSEMEIEGMNERLELEALNGELDALKTEKSSLQSAVLALRTETEQLKKGRVIAQQGELLSQTAVDVQSDAVTASVAEEAMEKLIQGAASYLYDKAAANGAPLYSTPMGPIKVTITDDVRRVVESQLSASSGGRRAMRLTAPSNVVEGQVVEGMVSVHESRLIFKKDEVLMAEIVRSDLGQDNTTDVLYSLLKQINRRAVAMGVLPDPMTGNVGNLGSIEFFEIVDKVNESGSSKKVTFLAAEDIYSEGPVSIRIDIEEASE
jgi:uncharacterized protein (DUF3084 family)